MSVTFVHFPPLLHGADMSVDGTPRWAIGTLVNSTASSALVVPTALQEFALVRCGLAQNTSPALVIPEGFRRRVLSLERSWNWDREGGRAIRRSACQAAVALAFDIASQRLDLPLPSAGPSPRGAVSLTWWSGDRSITAFLRTGNLANIPYEWEGPGYACGAGEATRSEVVRQVLSL